MKMSEMFPSKYLKAGDIPSGREVSVVIRDLLMVQIEGEDEPKPCLYFHGAKKGLIVNKTNGLVLAQALGDDSAQWLGKAVTLFATTTQFAGKLVPCVRLRIPPPASAPVAPVSPSAPAAAFDADLPFDNGAGLTADSSIPF